MGTSRAATTNPRSVALLVILNTNNGSATDKIPSPNCEIVWPIHNRSNSRLATTARMAARDDMVKCTQRQREARAGYEG